MNPDLYDAWVNAGIKLQPVGHWALANWDWLAFAVAVPFAVWAISRCLPRDDDYRSRNDAVAAQRITRFEERPEPGEPGSDDGLLLDCTAVYGDCAHLDRLRTVIDKAQKGEK